MPEPRLRRVDPSRFDGEGAGDDAASIFGLPYGEAECSVVLIPVPWEPTVSYGRGTAEGPQAIARASPQLDLFDLELAELGLARPWSYGIHMVAEDPAVRHANLVACELAAPIVSRGGAGDDSELRTNTARVDELSAKMLAHVRSATAQRIDRGQLVGVVGGDHSVAWAPIAATAERYRELAILHIDAHADLRRDFEGFAHSHASVMHNVLRDCDVARLCQVGVRDVSEAEVIMAQDDRRVVSFYDHAIRRRLDEGSPWLRICDDIIDALPGEAVYVSFDIDGLDPYLCPSTGTPVPGGLGFGQAIALLTRLAVRGKRIVGFDLVEVAPAPGGGDWDGNVAARLVYKLCGVALLSHGAQG